MFSSTTPDVLKSLQVQRPQLDPRPLPTATGENIPTSQFNRGQVLAFRMEYYGRYDHVLSGMQTYGPIRYQVGYQ